MKAASKPKAKPDNGKRISETAREGESEAQGLARVILSPQITAALTLHDVYVESCSTLSLDALIDELRGQANTVSTGNMGRPEAMLTAQAHTLDALFNRLARKAVLQIDEHPQATEIYMRLAFKAQAQARATVETLHEMKHPKPVAFVQQANIAHGPQQVNNGQVRAGAHAREIENKPNELLEQTHGERLDGYTPGAATAADTGLEAVGAVHRAANQTR
jgi:hypothetical protein